MKKLLKINIKNLIKKLYLKLFIIYLNIKIIYLFNIFIYYFNFIERRYINNVNF